jgi:Amt family ammonium transporter
MAFFTFLCGRSFRPRLILVLGLGFGLSGWLQAQTNTISLQAAPSPDGTNQIPVAPIAQLAPDTNTAPVVAAPASNTATNEAAPPPAPAVIPATSTPLMTAAPAPAPKPKLEITGAAQSPGSLLFPALLALGSLGGFVLYQTGLTRAKNCGHTSTLLLLGVFIALIGYWAGGFAVQNGGIGDEHAALSATPADGTRTALDHELGPLLAGHHWGLMGSAGFFLITDETAHNENPAIAPPTEGGGWMITNPPDTHGAMATLFLVGAAFLVIAVAAALGAALERARLLPMAVGAFLIGTIFYPLSANWTWGGGWLAELGREFVLGHGFVDQGGAVVVHATAGTLALVIAMVLGPRYGRVGREKAYRPIPGHNMPFVVLGASLLLVTFTAVNTFACDGPDDVPEVAAMNTLLAAAGGLLITYLAAGWRRKSPEPAVLCRGLLGGAVAVSGGSALIDPWAAFFIGAVAGLVVLAAMGWLDWRRIDDPTGASAVHGAAGIWGALAVGIFANGLAGGGCNGVEGPVRGLLFGGGWHQLAAQAIGATVGFTVIFVLGFVCFGLIQKILGTRADLIDEVEGLDWSQTGALGYQPDIEPGAAPGSSIP